MSETLKIIKQLRGRLSQTEIARRSGVSQSRISRWESGGVPAGADDVLRLLALSKELEQGVEPSHVGDERAPGVNA